jgi:hypothetical protein
VAGEIDAVCVVDDAIEDSVGIGGIADQFVPFVDGEDLADDGRPSAVAFFEDFEEIVAGGGIEGIAVCTQTSSLTSSQECSGCCVTSRSIIATS